MRDRAALRDKVAARIARRRDAVFLTREFRDLGGEDQVLRAMRGPVREKRLLRLGYGVYGRAFVSKLSGAPVLDSPNGFADAARQALTKLGVKWEPKAAERDYNEGRSTQVPVNPVVRVKGRFSRRLRYGNTEHEAHYWMQGRSSETDFIYVTTQSLAHNQLAALSEDVGEGRTLLVCCKAFRANNSDAFPNLTIKKIPQAVLRKCEWGHDDYSLNVANLLEAPREADEPDATVSKTDKKRSDGKSAAQDDLFGQRGVK